jgi:hypothetical protein
MSRIPYLGSKVTELARTILLAAVEKALRAIMRRILSEVLRRINGVEGRKGRAGALRIEFIERSRNQSLGIECVFAADRVEWSM